MIERVVNRRPDWTTFIGSTMVVVGLGFFVVVFVALFPVLTDPAHAYDRWFPVSQPTIDEPVPTIAEPLGPEASFRWEAMAVESADRTAYQVRLTAERTVASEVVAWRWDFGDGTTGSGEALVHEYSSFGTYTVALTVEDADGLVDTLQATVVMHQLDRSVGSSGRVDDSLAVGDDLQSFGDGINTTLQDAVGSVGDDINTTIDSALGSIGATVRGAVVAMLFALAAFAATIVAWRTARIGVMLLTRDPRASVGDRSVLSRSDDMDPSGHELEIVR